MQKSALESFWARFLPPERHLRDSCSFHQITNKLQSLIMGSPCNPGDFFRSLITAQLDITPETR